MRISEVRRSGAEANLREERAELRAVYRVVRRGFILASLLFYQIKAQRPLK